MRKLISCTARKSYKLFCGKNYLKNIEKDPLNFKLMI